MCIFPNWYQVQDVLRQFCEDRPLLANKALAMTFINMESGACSQLSVNPVPTTTHLHVAQAVCHLQVILPHCNTNGGLLEPLLALALNPQIMQVLDCILWKYVILGGWWLYDKVCILLFTKVLFIYNSHLCLDHMCTKLMY